MDARIERHAAAERRVHRHRAADDRTGEQVLRREQRHERERRRHLRAIQERQPLLRPEHERLDAGGFQRDRAIVFLAADAHAPFADQCERKMRERREIARSADRALAGHDRMDPRIDEREQLLDDDGAHTGVTAREARRLQHEDQAHGRVRERRADARSMRAHQIELQRRELVVRNPCLRELAEAGIDAIERFAAGESRTHSRETRPRPGRASPR